MECVSSGQIFSLQSQTSLPPTPSIVNQESVGSVCQAPGRFCILGLPREVGRVSLLLTLEDPGFHILQLRHGSGAPSGQPAAQPALRPGTGRHRHSLAKLETLMLSGLPAVSYKRVISVQDVSRLRKPAPMAVSNSMAA